MNRALNIFRHVAAASLALGLAMASSTGAAAGDRNSLTNYGSLVAGDRIDRTIVLNPDAKYVNVTNGETVKFVVRQADGSERSFAWWFDLFPTVRVIDMSKIAPAGTLVHDLRVYVAPDPRWLN